MTVLLVAALATLYATREQALFPLAGELAEEAMEAQLGGQVEIEDLGGDAWTRVTVRRLTVETASDSGATLRALEAREVEVSLSVFGLIQGDRDWLRSVRAAEVVAHLDISADSEGGARAPASTPAACRRWTSTASTWISRWVRGGGWD